MSGDARRRRSRGQALVELTMVLPILLLLLLGMTEMGLALNANVNLEFATREAARVGAALGPGSATTPWTDVDPQVIAAAERALHSAGISLSDVTRIRIYQADANGNQVGPYNDWMPGPGPVIDGVPLSFHSTSSGWPANARINSLPPQSIGVSVWYTYHLRTPISALFGLWGSRTIAMTDHTVMALNPTYGS